MQEKIHVIQIGDRDLTTICPVPQNVTWVYLPVTPEEEQLYSNGKDSSQVFEALMSLPDPRDIDLWILGGVPEEFLPLLEPAIMPDVCYYTEKFATDSEEGTLLIKEKRGKFLSLAEPFLVRQFMALIPVRFFHGQYGSKLLTYPDADVGEISFLGHQTATIEKDFGSEFRHVFTWKDSIHMDTQRAMEFWLEYVPDPGVEIRMVLREYREDSFDEILHTWIVEGADLDKPYSVKESADEGDLSISIEARGKGKLQIGTLHYRHSRLDVGTLIPGGQRHVTKNRQELFSYFYPGDLQPPLMVFFSGYREKTEMFEAIPQLLDLEAPFLILTDRRLTGGAFFLGSNDNPAEYESLVEKTIEDTLNELGFRHDQMVMAGISMGSTPALYYGAKFRPSAVVAARPLMSIGSVAVNERFMHPGAFPAALDVLQMCTGGTDEEHVKALNQKIWEQFDSSNWTKTEIALAYMQEDDYDPTCYQDMLEHLKDKTVWMYGKGIAGRHNDNSAQVGKWFQEQAGKILQERFER